MDDQQLKTAWQNRQWTDTVRHMSEPLTMLMKHTLAKRVRQLGALAGIWDEVIPADLREADLLMVVTRDELDPTAMARILVEDPRRHRRRELHFCRSLRKECVFCCMLRREHVSLDVDIEEEPEQVFVRPIVEGDAHPEDDEAGFVCRLHCRRERDLSLLGRDI